MRSHHGPGRAALHAGLAWALCSQIAMAACPLATASRAVPAAAPLAPRDTSCLVSPRAIQGARVFDLRARADYLAAHIPGAEHADLHSLTRRADDAGRGMVVYDGGRFASDAYLLCHRLRRAGLTQARVIDGGIAAWAQATRHPQALVLGRLADTEVAAVLSEPSSRAVALSPALDRVLAEHGVARGAKPPAGGRRVVIGGVGTPQADLSRHVAGAAPTLYWLGSSEQLVSLLHAHLDLDRKRVSGPAESAKCSGL